MATEFSSIPVSALGVQELYELLSGAIQPRPVALVSTADETGRPNVAPFSFFNVMGVNPPCVVFGPSADGNGNDKATLRYIEATGEFVINLVSREMADGMAVAGMTSGEKWELAGLASTASSVVRPPRLVASPLQLECRLTQVVRMGATAFATRVVIGEIVHVHVVRSALLDPASIQPIARLGGAGYLDLGALEIFEVDGSKPAAKTS